jgi:hypothetical protein
MKPQTAENNSLFKFIVALVSFAGLTLFGTGIVADGALLSLGFVLMFTGLVGFASMKGINSGSMVRPTTTTPQASIHPHRQTFHKATA